MAGSKPSANKPSTTPPTSTWDERLITMLLPWRIELVGLLCALAGLLILLSLLHLTRSAPLNWISGQLRLLAGWGAYPLALTLIALGVHIALRQVSRPYRVRPTQVIGTELVLLSALALTHQLSGAGLAGAFGGKGGGLIGWALSEPLLAFLGPILTDGLQVTLLLVGVALVARVTWNDGVRWLTLASTRLHEWARQLEAQAAAMRAAKQVTTPPSAQPAEAPPPVVVPPPPPPRPAMLPPLSLLQVGKETAVSPQEITQKSRTIEQTLMDFGLPAKVTTVRQGPAVTQFGVTPGYIERNGPDGEPHQQKVRVGQIAALNKDLALALKVPRLRIEAPVPGRSVVGIEVPNMDISAVRLRAVLESDAFRRLKSPLAVALGRDVSGTAVATDLGRLPHLLIAGTTGSGKSVCLGSLISTLVFNNPPDRLKIVLIDPKKVELSRYNGLPHLLGNVETDHERVIGVLRWLTAEMDQRYQMFAELGARNITVYNERVSRRPDVQPLPYMAVFIDELADLMAMYPSDVERTLCRLAQMARATGIHLVVATQRPSTDVITGLIKANFPARIAFSVASTTDSRVVLDSVGAEHLLGRGDMLFLSPDASAPQRIQGCYVADDEIDAIVAHWRRVLPDYDAGTAPWEAVLARMQVIGQTDDLLEQAVAFAQEHDTVSASLLQRKLRVGYPRA
ncbi:MAG: DNA translocase FtsK, partial [Anaerolineales bacterium]|nr:DNA translocase FtsK [Anaerolineales bacterium]